MMKFKMIKDILIQSWWMIALILSGSVLYERAIQKRELQFIQLQEQLVSLQKEKKKVLYKQYNLSQQINSQSDPAWIELSLMKGLGVVPEDQQKVYFFPETEMFSESTHPH